MLESSLNSSRFNGLTLTFAQPSPLASTLRASRPNSGVDAVIRLFNDLFAGDLNTRLIGGALEPLYQPSDPLCSFHRIFFTRDYFASALHEVAHWCVAGPARRLRVDYGYWYEPDGRSAEQQSLFERVEVKPQALEWIFAKAAGQPFRVSADNLAAGAAPSQAFREAICAQARRYCTSGLPRRAALFAQGLADTLTQPQGESPSYLDPASYRLEDLI